MVNAIERKVQCYSQLPQKQEAQYVTQGQSGSISVRQEAERNGEKVEISLYWGFHGKVKAWQGKEFRIG